MSKYIRAARVWHEFKEDTTKYGDPSQMTACGKNLYADTFADTLPEGKTLCPICAAHLSDAILDLIK